MPAGSAAEAAGSGCKRHWYVAGARCLRTGVSGRSLDGNKVVLEAEDVLFINMRTSLTMDETALLACDLKLFFVKLVFVKLEKQFTMRSAEMMQLECVDVENPKPEQLLADCVLTHDHCLPISCEIDVLKLCWGQNKLSF